MTTKSKIEKLKKQQAEQLLELEQEERIAALLPNVGHEWSIHTSELYGSTGSVGLDQPWSYSAKPLTLEHLLEVAEALPGLPMVRVRGTYISYLAAKQLPHYGDSRGLHKIDSEEVVAPWIVKGRGGAGARNGSQCSVEWVTELPSIGMMTVNFDLPFMLAMRFTADRKNYMGGHTYSGETIHVDRSELFTIFDQEGATPLAELGPSTKWASGSSDYPSKVTQAWTPLNDPATVTVADFARALIAANKKEAN